MKNFLSIILLCFIFSNIKSMDSTQKQLQTITLDQPINPAAYKSIYKTGLYNTNCTLLSSLATTKSLGINNNKRSKYALAFCENAVIFDKSHTYEGPFFPVNMNNEPKETDIDALLTIYGKTKIPSFNQFWMSFISKNNQFKQIHRRVSEIDSETMLVQSNDFGCTKNILTTLFDPVIEANIILADEQSSQVTNVFRSVLRDPIIPQAMIKAKYKKMPSLASWHYCYVGGVSAASFIGGYMMAQNQKDKIEVGIMAALINAGLMNAALYGLGNLYNKNT